MEKNLSRASHRGYKLHPSQAVGLSHFHAVTDGVWFDVSHFLRSILRRRVEGQQRQTIEIDSSRFETLLDFVSQMSFSYRSPRRDSFCKISL